MKREEARCYQLYSLQGNGVSSGMVKVFKPKSFSWLIDKIYDDFEQQLADYKKRIEELELRLSLSDSALDEYKQQVASLEAPKSCEGCKYDCEVSYLICMHCSRDGEDMFTPHEPNKDNQ